MVLTMLPKEELIWIPPPAEPEELFLIVQEVMLGEEVLQEIPPP
jgi:hypothetical protein